MSNFLPQEPDFLMLAETLDRMSREQAKVLEALQNDNWPAFSEHWKNQQKELAWAVRWVRRCAGLEKDFDALSM